MVDKNNNALYYKHITWNAHMIKPLLKPSSPCFSSGPCNKHPGWSLNSLKESCIGRSHRSYEGREKLKSIIDQSRELLAIPKDYKVAITAGSDTGAFELAMWSLLGPKAVDVLIWDFFSKEWAISLKQLSRLTVYEHTADYGDIPDLTKTNKHNDIIFCWNGTTSGVKIPHCQWIDDNRSGLTFCDATSAIFSYDIEWNKLDVTTYSWQKSLGGEAQHGMLVLSPRAIERLKTHTPTWPLPKIFRLVKNGKIIDDIFEGSTINTPSLLAVEDFLSALNWAKSIGGLETLIKRTQNNLSAVKSWVNQTPWIEFLAHNESITSSTSICLKITDPSFQKLSTSQQKKASAYFLHLLKSNKVAYDINSHREAPIGLRIWGGPTIETSCLKSLFPWLEWAQHNLVKSINSNRH